ncbi:tRNA dihydrouridine synthase DusB [Mollicutes bacterium LVI A0039]|nr:tRNA dihydrouridine synthase DusB [Mollicutes bacterium LVI A0039]
MTKLKIREIELDSPVILAPMAGVTNQAFKQIVRELGAGLIATEMVNDKGLIHGNERTRKMIELTPEEHPVSHQLFGSEIESLVAAAKILDVESECDIIDINMGCPAPKITKNASGSKLLQDPKHAYNIVKAIVAAVEKPVTVKMRIGWDEKSIIAVEFAKLMEKAGASLITVHGRTTKQQYSGKANWEIIRDVKNAVSIPVVGNGDIDSALKAKEMIEYSGVDGVMIGRAALGNPWIIKQVSEYLQTGVLIEEPSTTEKLQTAIRHLDRLIELKGNKLAILEMRSHASWYIKGIPGANRVKKELQMANSREDYLEIFNKLMESDVEC